LLFRFEPINNAKHRRQLFDALIKMSTLEHPHLLKIESVSYDDHARLCVITPYTGNHEGLVTLEDLLRVRDGKLGTIETTRAIEQLLDASSFAHTHGIVNGTVSPSDILVDRYGCLQIQFYGLETLTHATDDIQKEYSIKALDEIRSIVDLGYTMMTGLSTQSDRIAPSRVVKKLDRAWDTWFDLGLDPIDGFEDIAHAINALPTNPNCAEWLAQRSSRRPQVHIGSMLRRFRAVPGSSARHH